MPTLSKILKLFSSINLGEGYKFANDFIGPPSKSYRDVGFRNFFRIKSIRYDTEAPRLEAFENVLGTFTEPAFHLIYILSGRNDQVNVDIGAVVNLDFEPNQASENKSPSIRQPADIIDIVEHAFRGNFPGSRIEKMPPPSHDHPSHPYLFDLPRSALITGIPTVYGNIEQVRFQGMDRLINSMRGDRWAFVVIARPLTSDQIWQHLDLFFKFYTHLSPHVSTQEQISEMNTDSSVITKEKSKNSSKSFSSTSTHEKRNSSSNSHIETANESNSNSISEIENSQTGKNFSKNKILTTTTASKKLQDLVDFIDKQQIPRFKQGLTTGMFLVSAFALAEDNSSLRRLVDCIQSFFQADSASYSRLRACYLTDKSDWKNDAFFAFQILRSKLTGNEEVPLLFGHSINQDNVMAATILTTKELALLAGLPQREVPGIEVSQGIDFGLNVPIPESQEDRVHIGHMLHRGEPLSTTPVYLDKNALTKHVFVAGATGYGKTTTCQKLLIDSGLPFIVIEPAKTEYRTLRSKLPSLLIFTLGNENLAPFRLNPFELLPDEPLGPHIDMIKTAFMAAFPMEAAMPQLLEEAIYETYKSVGWDIHSGTNIYCKDPWKAKGAYWPTIEDLLHKIPEVIKKKKFDTRLEHDYIGSLTARVVGFTVGAKGRMINTRRSFDFDSLLDRQVIFEMEDLPDSQDKALLMGLLLVRLRTALRLRNAKATNFKHLTLIEEAHRLLSRADASRGGSQYHAISTFTDLLAEVRQYGEGLIIVDQIPSKLAPEVMKNTSTKIIHRLLALDDKETVGATMALSTEQANFLSNLQVGEAVAFSESWPQPILLKIDSLNTAKHINTNQSYITKDKGKNKEQENIQIAENSAFSSIANDNQNLQELGTRQLWEYKENLFPGLPNFPLLVQNKIIRNIETILDNILELSQANIRLDITNIRWINTLDLINDTFEDIRDDEDSKNVLYKFLTKELLNRISRKNFIDIMHIKGNSANDHEQIIIELWDIIFSCDSKRFDEWKIKNPNIWSDLLKR